MNTKLLLGTWRSTKIEYYKDNVEHFRDEDNWRQYEIAAQGQLTEQSHYRGVIVTLPYPLEWSAKNGRIIITKMFQWEFLVTELTQTDMVVKGIDSKITWTYKRMSDVEKSK